MRPGRATPNSPAAARNRRVGIKRQVFLIAVALIFGSVVAGCKESEESGLPPLRTRAEAIPPDAVKQTPAGDVFPPVLHSNEWEAPVPMPGPVNTAGAEDAPVMSRDGNTFYFFFTPDVRVPPNRQLFDGVSGIWWTHRTDSTWSEPERIILSDDLSLDGPVCIVEDTLWFASFRQGNYRDDGDLYIATLVNGRWQNWHNAGEQLNLTYNAGENYTTGDSRIMFFGREGYGGYGGRDLWTSERTVSGWSEPVNLGPTVNTTFNESHCYVTADGRELWFTSESRLGYTGPALFRTMLTDSGWTYAEEIVSNFAGDPALDDAGNLYFTHHYYSSDIIMIEADIYLACRR